jgi:hypothetical protein
MTLIVELHRWLWAWWLALAGVPLAALCAKAYFDSKEH